MKQLQYIALFVASFALFSCGGNDTPTDTPDTTDTTATVEEQEVNVYTHRHYDADQQLFDKFTETTGIKVNVVKAKADELMVRLETEGENSPADLLVTVDAGRLVQAKEKGVLQSIHSDVLEQNIPENLRDEDGYWYGQTIRARIVVYAKDRVTPEMLTTYEDLTNPQWKGKLLTRSSENIYNQSLMASLIVHHGEERAKAWAEEVVANMARAPKGNDRDQVKAIAAGQGDIAIVNTYYIGKLLNSDDEAEVAAGEGVGIFFPNQNDRGAHINISGAGVTKYAPNKENAIKLLEFLSGNDAQRVFAEANYEYPVKPGVEYSSLLQSWGEFKADSISLSLLGINNSAAVKLFDEAGWK